MLRAEGLRGRTEQWVGLHAVFGRARCMCLGIYLSSSCRRGEGFVAKRELLLVRRLDLEEYSESLCFEGWSMVLESVCE